MTFEDEIYKQMQKLEAQLQPLADEETRRQMLEKATGDDGFVRLPRQPLAYPAIRNALTIVTDKKRGFAIEFYGVKVQLPTNHYSAINSTIGPFYSNVWCESTKVSICGKHRALYSAAMWFLANYDGPLDISNGHKVFLVKKHIEHRKEKS